MDTCSFVDFMNVLTPWLNRDYIRQANFDDQGNFTLMFVDGGQSVYHVDGCTSEQLNDVLRLMKENDVPVYK